MSLVESDGTVHAVWEGFMGRLALVHLAGSRDEGGIRARVGRVRVTGRFRARATGRDRCRLICG